MIATARLVRIAPTAAGAARDDGPLVRDLAAWVIAPSITGGDLELGPLPFLLPPGIPVDELVADVDLSALEALVDRTVVIASLDDRTSGLIVLPGTVLPT